MDDGSLGAALEREHREIDAGIEAFASGGGVESLTRAATALRRHIYLEEEFLFPALRSELAVPTIVMVREHGELWRTLDRLDAELAAGGDDASLRDLCRALLALLDAHNAKEEPILYTRPDAGLPAAANAGLRAFLGSGELPADWVCQAA
jgi:hemerythrin-like domain-containing protein